MCVYVDLIAQQLTVVLFCFSNDMSYKWVCVKSGAQTVFGREVLHKTTTIFENLFVNNDSVVLIKLFSFCFLPNKQIFYYFELSLDRDL